MRNGAEICGQTISTGYVACHAIKCRFPVIIWPETAFAGLLDREAALFKETVWSALPFDGWMITGVPRFDETGRLFNSAALVGLRVKWRHSIQNADLFPSVNLCRFGRGCHLLMRLLARWISPADENVVFDLPGYGLIQVQICYEAIFPKMISRGRPDILVNLTNDAWFGNTPDPGSILPRPECGVLKKVYRHTCCQYGFLLRLTGGRNWRRSIE